MTEEPEQPTPPRLTSLDALRGFDMFWIIGGSGLVIALTKVLGLPDDLHKELAIQMTHVKWEGFRFYDLIFPLFVFISGAAIPYAILSKKEKGVPVLSLQLGIVKRAAVLILIGLSFSVFLFQPEKIRLYTVLWLIGMSYLIGASIALHVDSWKAKLIIAFSVLLLYHLALFYLPYPGKGPEITPANNLAAWCDRNGPPGNLYRQVYDPEGSIRVVTGGMLCLLGSLAGQRIRHFREAKSRCGLELFIAGLCSLLLGWLWGLAFPIIKDLWSPSFILWSAGWSLLLLSIFYTVMDVWRQKWLGWVFIPIGMNAIVIYAAQWYFPFRHVRDFFFKGYASTMSNHDTQQLIMAIGLVLVQWLLLFWLYRKKIFIRV